MNLDDVLPPPATEDPLKALRAQDLDRLSVAECEARIETLKAEIGRTERRLSSASQSRSAADALFRRN